MKKATIVKWMKKHPKTKKPMYYFHVEYANGNIGDSQKFASRSGRSKAVRKLLSAGKYNVKAK